MRIKDILINPKKNLKPRNISALIFMLLLISPKYLTSQNKTFLTKGSVMTVGDKLYSEDGKLYWVIEKQGTSVRYTQTNKLFWGTNNYSFNDFKWKFQYDGNFCLNDSKDRFKWCSMVYNQVEKFILTNDGYLAQLDVHGNELWTSKKIFKVTGTVSNEKNGNPISGATVGYGLNTTMMYGTLYFANSKTNSQGKYSIYTTNNADWSFNCNTCGQKEIKTSTNTRTQNVTLRVTQKIFGYKSKNIFFKNTENLQFGYKQELDSNLQLYTSKDEYSLLNEGSELPYLQNGKNGNMLIKLTSEAAKAMEVPKGTFVFNFSPDLTNNISVIKFTAPENGIYKVNAKWSSTESNEVTTFVNFDTQSQNEFSFKILKKEDEKFSYSKDINLKKGSWIEFLTSAKTKYLQTAAVLELNITKITRDSDGDGITDDKDGCPNEKGVAANNGCPYRDADRDRDGVLDKDDSCPYVVGTINNKGCPEVTEEIQKTINEYAKTILFNPGRSSIKRASEDVLDDIMIILREYPNSKFTIEVHTSNVGNAATNLKLSQNRANAVKNYLILNGVDQRRLTSVGYGESKPITSNKTRNKIEINLVKD